MELSIIILNYKTRGMVKNCLRSIRESNLTFPHEIIVVDNHSRDGVAALLEQDFPGVRFFPAPKNLGMGAGNNLGLREAKGRFVLIVNPDIFILPGAIHALHEYLNARPDIGVLGPRLLNPDRSLQHTCYKWHRFWTPIYRRTFLGGLAWARKELDRFLMRDWDHQDIREVDWIQGSCWLVAKAVLDKVGLFDERFFMYFEDTDLCRRMKQAGFKNIYFPEAEVIHYHGRQSGGGPFGLFLNRMTRVHIVSWLRYLAKWRGAT